MSADDFLKLFARLGANGVIVMMVWALIAALTLLGKLPADEDGQVHAYKMLLQYILATTTVVTSSFFITWNVFGRPKRLGADISY